MLTSKTRQWPYQRIVCESNTYHSHRYESFVRLYRPPSRERRYPWYISVQGAWRWQQETAGAGPNTSKSYPSYQWPTSLGRWCLARLAFGLELHEPRLEWTALLTRQTLLLHDRIHRKWSLSHRLTKSLRGRAVHASRLPWVPIAPERSLHRSVPSRLELHHTFNIRCK